MSPDSTDTLPPEPLPTDEYEVPILAGHAQEALSSALDDLVRAVRRVEAVGAALARQVDATVPRTP